MAQFYARIITARSEVHRLGHKTTGIVTECNGWTGGIRVEAAHSRACETFRVFVTGGSNQVRGDKLIGKLVLVNNTNMFTWEPAQAPDWHKPVEVTVIK